MIDNSKVYCKASPTKQIKTKVDLELPFPIAEIDNNKVYLKATAPDNLAPEIEMQKK